MANDVAILAILCVIAAAQTTPEIGKIVQESARVTDADREAAPSYDYSEKDTEPDGTKKTYSVRMLFGSPYQELTAIDGKLLSPDEQKNQKRRLNQEISRRQNESPDDRAHRIEQFQKEEHRDRRIMEEFVHAFDFTLVGDRDLDGRIVYVVRAAPRRGYRPTDKESEVLTGMRGQLWIDRQTYQWVKVEATVIHPVSIEGFVARVEPSTRFELEKAPVEDNIWLPRHFSMTSKAKIFFVFPYNNNEDVTYSDYHKSPHVSGEAK